MHSISRTDQVLLPAGAEPGAPLDPRRWDELRALGHRMLDDVFGHLEGIRDQPVWRPVPDDVRARLRAPLAPEGIGESAAYEEFLRDVLPYPVGNTHPRFWGWVIGSGMPLGVLGELLAATMNPNVSGLQGAPRLVEEQVLGWLGDMVGYPAGASGILVSGGSMANILGLAVGLDSKSGFDVGRRGLAACPRPLALYGSGEAHFSVAKAARLLGVGTGSLRAIPVGADYRMDIEALEATIRRDRADGRQPFAVVGTAGSTNTGAFDDLEALAALAEREGLWFHVDGAFGAFAALVPELAHLVRGMERADSLAFDLHKWMMVPIEAGVVLVRDAAAHRRAFAVTADYVADVPGGIGHDAMFFADRGLQLTRGFRALKVWLALKAYGIEPFADLVRRNVHQARYLARTIREAESLELLAPVPLNVVNYRYRPSDSDPHVLNELNQAILVRLHEDGIAAPSYTNLDGRFAIRVCITNHRTQLDDLDRLLEATVRLGRALEMRRTT